MADDTTIASATGGDRIANDELATLNGVATVADGAGKLPKAQRVKLLVGADGVGTDVSSAAPLPTIETSLAVGEYMAASFRVVGSAANPINLCTIENTAGSARRVQVRRIAIDISVSTFAAAYALQSYFRLWHRTGVTPTGGTQPAKTVMNSADAASAANAIVRFPASADGTASAITHALPVRSPDREQSHPQFMWATAAAFAVWNPADFELHDYAKPPLVLNAGETLLVALAGANSSTAFHYGVKVIWEEF